MIPAQFSLGLHTTLVAMSNMYLTLTEVSFRGLLHNTASDALSMHLAGEWSSPDVHSRPPPLAGFTLTKISDYQAILLGGYSSGDLRNPHVYTLHLDTIVNVNL